MICSGYKIELFVIQDLINKMASLYFAKDEEAMKKFTEEARATALANLEKKLENRGVRLSPGPTLTSASTSTSPTSRPGWKPDQ